MAIRASDSVMYSRNTLRVNTSGFLYFFFSADMHFAIIATDNIISTIHESINVDNASISITRFISRPLLAYSLLVFSHFVKRSLRYEFCCIICISHLISISISAIADSANNMSVINLMSIIQLLIFC